MPPLCVGTSIRPALVCSRLGDPGGLGSFYLTFRDRNIFWSFVSLRVLSCGLPSFHVAASDVQLQMPFSKSFPAVPGSLARKLACPRLQPLTYSLPAIVVHWLANLRVQRKPSLWLFSAGGNRRAASHAYKDLTIILNCGCWSPGFWCCSSWCQSLDLSTFQQRQHLPLPQMLYGRGTTVVPSCWGCYLKI